MLTTLYIENIAVIEKTSIDFSQGLNVLTGETGAGKSIIIDSINAIMGQRTSKELRTVRSTVPALKSALRRWKNSIASGEFALAPKPLSVSVRNSPLPSERMPEKPCTG